MEAETMERMSKRIIFLDVDGVCNSQGSTIAFGTTRKFDDIAVRLIHHAAKELDCKIVLSSAWRFDDLAANRKIFASRGHLFFAALLIGSTTRENRGVRGDQIAQWLAEHEPCEYAILDDDSDMLPEQMARFIKTDRLTGFRFPEYLRLLALFDPTHVTVRAFRNYTPYAQTLVWETPLSPIGTPATNMQSATVGRNDASPSEPNAVAVNLDAQERK